MWSLALAAEILAPLFLVMMPNSQFVIHHLAVARPLHRGVGAADAEAVGDVVDRLLAIDLRQFAERLGVDPRQFRHVVLGARGELELPARGLQDVQRERHAVPHLPRLRDRRENFGALPPGPTRSRPCRACRTLLRACSSAASPASIRASIDAKAGLALPSRLAAAARSNSRRIAGMHDGDLVLAAGFECCEFHLIDPLLSDEIYDQRKYR